MSLSTCGVHEFCREKFKLVQSFSCPSSVLVNMIYCSVKNCSNSSITGVILHSIIKTIKTPNHPAYHWSTLWPLEVWVCVHKISMLIYLCMGKFLAMVGVDWEDLKDIRKYLPSWWEIRHLCFVYLERTYVNSKTGVYTFQN